MSISIAVALLSGRSRVITAHPDSTVDDLRLQAQLSLKVGLERLVTETGVILQGKSTLRASHVQSGATLTAHVRQSQLVSSALAFALLRSDGTVVSWGNAVDGGDSSAVQDELKDVNQIQSTLHAFAAIRSDGSVVAWGKMDDGGLVPSAVGAELVNEIQGTENCFAAIRGDGGVVTWGNGDFAPDGPTAEELLQDVQQQVPTSTIGSDGSVVTWGRPLSSEG
ncbi:Putative E3 ubiquitin-protein ligase HERC2 [Durusdinium trenchii]|uniref:E3 ubiquitin-protein ligase HERC2 n=1 Tax=Durusdinium trenchii TaxID=1381693 RepID=A0ABP0P6Z2_9DINO